MAEVCGFSTKLGHQKEVPWPLCHKMLGSSCISDHVQVHSQSLQCACGLHSKGTCGISANRGPQTVPLALGFLSSPGATELSTTSVLALMSSRWRRQRVQDKKPLVWSPHPLFPPTSSSIGPNEGKEEKMDLGDFHRCQQFILSDSTHKYSSGRPLERTGAALPSPPLLCVAPRRRNLILAILIRNPSKPLPASAGAPGNS